ncbi:hypothetical protein ABIB45_003260 [Arthrobacter sp. UYCo732]
MTTEAPDIMNAATRARNLTKNAPARIPGAISGAGAGSRGAPPGRTGLLAVLPFPPADTRSTPPDPQTRPQQSEGPRTQSMANRHTAGSAPASRAVGPLVRAGWVDPRRSWPHCSNANGGPVTLQKVTGPPSYVLGVGIGGDYGTCRSSGPLYSLSGRISELDAACSMMCAVQPVIRLATKSGVNVGVSKPMRWYVGPAG